MDRKLERRAAPGALKGQVEGYAVYWDRPSEVGGLQESFRRDSLKPSKSGVSLYLQHNGEGLPLATSQAGTLQLEADERGLKFRAQLPDSAAAVKESVLRGDLSGASVAFYDAQDDISGGKRVIREASLYEISLVDKPAHVSEVSLRKNSPAPRKSRRERFFDLL